MSRRSIESLAWIGVALLVGAIVISGLFRPQPAGPAGGGVVPVAPIPPADDIAPAPIPPTPPAPNPGDVAPAGDTPGPTGYQPNPAGTREFLRTLDKPRIREAGPNLFDRRGPAQEKKAIFLYRSLYKAYAEFYGGEQWRVGAQGIGDCVSWGWAHGADIHLAVMWELGDSGEWKPAATESIYGGSRVEARGTTFGGWGDGSYGGAAAKWVKNWGVVFRQPYTEFNLDLSTYSSSRAKNWGAYGSGGQGDAGRFDAEAKKHPVRNVAVVSNFDEAAAAISSGYPIPVCSGQGFSKTRDKDGFCRASGSWSHCMCFIAVRYEPRPGLLCLNSWGPNSCSGPKWPEDQPDGSFWVDANIATRMLSGEDSFAVSGYEGFPYKDLNNGDWVLHQPRDIERFYVRLRESGQPGKSENSETESHFALAP